MHAEVSAWCGVCKQLLVNALKDFVITLLLFVAMTVNLGEIAEVCSPSLPVSEKLVLASQAPALPGASCQSFFKEGQFPEGFKIRVSFSGELQAGHLCLKRRPGTLEVLPPGPQFPH